MRVAMRTLVRGSRLAAVTAYWFFWLVLRDLAVSLRSDAGLRRLRHRQRAMRSWCAAVCWSLGVRVEVRGEAPREACFLVCNHLGYLDIPVIGSQVGTVFVSKSEVADWPVIGRLATRGGTIYVERAAKRRLPEVNQQIRTALERGDGVVVFPEGTSSGGASVLDFRPSLLVAATELGLPVHMASLSYATGPRDPDPSESVCWWRDMEFMSHVRGLLKLSEIRATLCFVKDPVRAEDRKDLAQALWHGVSSAHRSSA